MLLNDINGPIAFRHFENMGGGKVAAPEKVALVCDHFVPAPNAPAARLLGDMRRFAEQKGIEHFYDAGKGGIEHTLIPEQGLLALGISSRAVIPIPGRRGHSTRLAPA